MGEGIGLAVCNAVLAAREVVETAEVSLPQTAILF